MTTKNNILDALDILRKYNFDIQNILLRKKWNKTVKKSPFLIQIVPDKFITQEICNIAFEYDPFLIKFIPDRFITQEMCDKAFKCSIYLFKYFPHKFITPDMLNYTSYVRYIK